ncbi:uncharacterized protein G2W53_029132 [Senna tora]|uniref:Uncharacterized protein n=1 Tax=Senna tora TaxID=362788 RepID=A0A834WBI6_9FABA|nr:uncharacterized protein G2W53_029132 [Senna tora]
MVGTMKGSMAFWYSGSGRRYETSKEKGKVFMGMRGTTDMADIFRVMGTSWLRRWQMILGHRGLPFLAQC